jgi:hypothetical protein
MQIIFSREVAEELRKQHTVLELETIVKDGVTIDAYCVVPADRINLAELSQLEHNCKLHQAFVDAYKIKDFKICNDLFPHILGKFGGEVDTFYQEIVQRIANLQQDFNTR